MRLDKSSYAVPPKKKMHLPSWRSMLFGGELNFAWYQSQRESLWSLLATGHCNSLWPLERIHDRPTNGGTASTYYGPGHRTRGEIGSRNETHKRAIAPCRRCA